MSYYNRSGGSGDISIPVRQESRHFWQSDGGSGVGGSRESLRDKFAHERHRMEREMEDLKRRFRGRSHDQELRSRPPVVEYSSSSRPDNYNQQRDYSSNYNNNRNQYSSSSYQSNDAGRDYYHQPTGGAGSGAGSSRYYPSATYPPPAEYRPLSVEPFPSTAGAIQGFVKNPEWRYVETGPNGQKCVKLQFDMAAYRPEEIQVLVDRDYLKIKARHEEGGPNRSVYREYNREFTLPSAIRSNQITSHLSRDGLLTVEAPLPPDYDYRRNELGFDTNQPPPRITYR